MGRNSWEKIGPYFMPVKLNGASYTIFSPEALSVLLENVTRVIRPGMWLHTMMFLPIFSSVLRRSVSISLASRTGLQPSKISRIQSLGLLCLGSSKVIDLYDSHWMCKWFKDSHHRSLRDNPKHPEYSFVWASLWDEDSILISLHPEYFYVCANLWDEYLITI